MILTEMHSADEAVPHVDVRQKIIKVNTFPHFSF